MHMNVVSITMILTISLVVRNVVFKEIDLKHIDQLILQLVDHAVFSAKNRKAGDMLEQLDNLAFCK